MTTSETPSTKKTSRRGFFGVVWKGLNSAFVIALLSALTATLLTQWFADRQADSADLAARRAELSRDIVEMQLRTARLTAIGGQYEDRRAFTSAEMTRIGERAEAIVSADSQTVTSDPSFKDVHIVTVLGRAETAAGLDLSDKTFLLALTDRDGFTAAALSANMACRLDMLVSYLQEHFQSGDFPLRLTDRKGRTFASATYALRGSTTVCSEQGSHTSDHRS